MIKISPSKGKLLIAEPSILTDKSFNRSVVYLTEHTSEGSIGFILNKPTEYILSDLIPEISCDFTVFNGGPVEKENLYFIHKSPHLIPDSIQISNEMYWGGDFEVLTELLNNGIIKDTEIRFFLGYSGWSEKQLIEELKDSNWIVTENKLPNIFDINSNDFWKNQLLEFGGEYQIWANAPENPALN